LPGFAGKPGKNLFKRIARSGVCAGCAQILIRIQEKRAFGRKITGKEGLNLALYGFPNYTTFSRIRFLVMGVFV
jgi:hypothetical protein